MLNKKSYFQGTEEPTPKKKKYKSDKAIVVQPRFKEPLFKNYDLYETPGEHTPGGGFYQNMDKYKSVKEFIEHKRKRNKAKYESDDSWQLDDGTRTKKNSDVKARALIFNKIIKLANDENLIDFPIDDQIGSDPILGNSGTFSDSVPIGGQLDEYLTLPDFEGKSVDQLNFGRDYAEESEESNLDRLSEKYLTPAEPSLYGLPDGISPVEDLDADKTINDINPYYGINDSKSNIYDNI